MMRLRLLLFAALCTKACMGQLAVARDTISVIENGYVLKMPWGNGLNFANISSTDLNFDGKKDIVAYDRLNQFGTGRFRCFLNVGQPGEIKFKASPELSYNFPKVSNWAVLLDYNCDGMEDIFCSTSAGIKVYKNTSSNGNLSFTLFKPLLYSYFIPGIPISLSNLYASTVGVPGIADVDGDGDLDILTFSPLGIFAEFHRNLAKDSLHSCDSLVFEMANQCWGQFSESNCAVNFNQCGGSKPAPSHTLQIPYSEKTYHAGACLTCLDSDGDGDQDLILGDISCNRVEYIHNTGTTVATPLMSDTTRLYPNFPNKNNTTTIRLNNFPCTYYVDVNDDGKKDLIATPNAFGSENTKSVWYYENVSNTNTVNFQYVKNNFLQDEMIDVGQNSFPVVFDADGDGLKDLLIGTYGYYINNSLKSQLTLYKNVGTLSQPAFSLVTRDYANLSAQNLNNVMPTVGDIDNDGDTDICIGTSSGQIHWLKNTAGAGNPCVFTFSLNPFTFTTTSAAAAPQLFDLDGDGKLDLLIGMKNGRVAYYKNNSSNAATPSFTLITSTLGGIDTRDDINLYGIDGYAVPYFYNDGGTKKALVGGVNGNIFQYIVPANLTGTFTPVTANTNGYNEGGQATICFEDINNDGKRDLIVGNAGGGLAFFSSNSPLVSVQELSSAYISNNFSVFPNPTTGVLNLQLSQVAFDDATVEVLDIVGKQVLQSQLQSTTGSIDLQSLQPGVYFVRLTLHEQQQAFVVTKKIIRN